MRTTFIIICLFFFAICNAQKPTINSFFPEQGPSGTLVTITGTNFSSDISKNIVYFGLAKATVLDASGSSLLVKVPSGATFQPISVLTNNLVGWSVKPFRLTFNNAGMDFSNSSFAPAVGLGGGASIALADFNNDGKLDIADGGFYQSSIAVYKNTTVDSIFSSVYGWSTGFQNPRDVKAADMNGDGLVDLLVSRSYDNIIAIYKNKSTLNQVSFEAVPTVCAVSGFGLGEFIVTDVDNDGRLDIAATVEQNDKITLFKNTSSGGSISFSAGLDITTEYAPWKITAADLNGDTLPELLVNGYNTTTGFTIHLNQSTTNSIGFSTTTITIPKYVTDLAAGDIDGDGLVDIAITNSGPNTVSILLNTATNQGIAFNSPIVIPTASTPNDIIFGDFNGDGKADLAMNASFSNNDVCILKNNSTPGILSMATYQTFPVGSGNFDITMGDMNGDGKIDIVTGNSQGNRVSISYLKNQMDLQYQQPVLDTFATISDGNWDNPATWQNNQVPPQGASVIIKHNVLANINRLISKLSIGPGAHLTVNSAITLTVLQ